MQKVSKKGGLKRRIIVGILMSALGLSFLTPFTPKAFAATSVTAKWLGAYPIQMSGSAFKNSFTITGSFYTNMAGFGSGTTTFVASSDNPVAMSFGCTTNVAIAISSDNSGNNIDYSSGSLTFDP